MLFLGVRCYCVSHFFTNLKRAVWNLFPLHLVKNNQCPFVAIMPGMHYYFHCQIGTVGFGKQTAEKWSQWCHMHAYWLSWINWMVMSSLIIFDKTSVISYVSGVGGDLSWESRLWLDVCPDDTNNICMQEMTFTFLFTWKDVHIQFRFLCCKVTFVSFCILFFSS